MSRLTDTSLLVVGGGSGIGLAAARIAAAEGARVLVADLDPTAEPGAREIGAGFVACDARDPASAAAAVAAACQRYQRLDCVITTVGGAHLGSLEELEPELWEQEISFNLTSAYMVCRAAVPVMREQRGGAIVTTASGYANLPGPDRPAYVAAKAGVIAFTRTVAATLAPFGARANCVAPGPTDTPRFRAMNGGDAGVERVRLQIPLGQIPTPEDVARVELFLASADACQVTGQVLHVNGGLLMV